jgi:hypothetical protein
MASRPLLDLAAPILRFSLLSPLEGEDSYDYFDAQVLEYFTSHNIPLPKGYGIVRPAWSNVSEQLHLGDKREVYEIPPEVEKIATKFLHEHFGMFKGLYRKTTLDNVAFDPKTSSGFPFNRTQPSNKGVSCFKYDEYFRWYCEPGNTERPPVVFKVTPKVEYLAEEKIKRNKIRLFRNPPLDFLLLEKIYFQQQENALLQYGRKTWSALGFVKEKDGWDAFIRDLLRKKWFYRWDVKNWDKSLGPRLFTIADNLRRTFFADDEVINEIDWKFLADNVAYAYELLFNGELFSTSIAQKSGTLRTSTTNTICHIYLLFVHYVWHCLDNSIEPSYKHCMEVMNNYVYSDDMQGSTDNIEFVAEDALRRTFQAVGMDIQDYSCTHDPLEIHFLGANNTRFRFESRDVWIPHYDENRMLYAALHLGGRMDAVTRAMHLSGLLHNVCFTPTAKILLDMIEDFNLRGLWPDSVPIPNIRELRLSYINTESAGPFFPCSPARVDV